MMETCISRETYKYPFADNNSDTVFEPFFADANKSVEIIENNADISAYFHDSPTVLDSSFNGLPHPIRISSCGDFNPNSSLFEESRNYHKSSSLIAPQLFHRQGSVISSPMKFPRCSSIDLSSGHLQDNSRPNLGRSGSIYKPVLSYRAPGPDVPPGLYRLSNSEYSNLFQGNTTTNFLSNYKTSHCKNDIGHSWRDCEHSHGTERDRRDPSEYNYHYDYCINYNKNTKMWTCESKENCIFAHTKEEELFHPIKYKVNRCKSPSIAECANTFCAFYHAKKSPLTDYPNLKELLLRLTDRGGVVGSPMELSHEERAQLIMILSGYAYYDFSAYNQDCYVYIRFWLLSYFNQHIATMPSFNSNRPRMDDFFYAKAALILYEVAPPPFENLGSCNHIHPPINQ